MLLFLAALFAAQTAPASAPVPASARPSAAAPAAAGRPGQDRPAPAGQPVPQAAPAAQGRADLGYVTAGALADRCNDPAAASVSYCFAYVAAVHDAMRAYEVWLGLKEFCVPATMSQADLRRAFLTYVSAYPTDRGGQAASVIVIALKETYPCAVQPEGDPAAPARANPRPGVLPAGPPPAPRR
jgi:hypothetical protein